MQVRDVDCHDSAADDARVCRVGLQVRDVDCHGSRGCPRVCRVGMQVRDVDCHE